jgi:hypothetical protein
VQAINEQGSGCLPLILVEGAVVSHGGYPDKKELAVLAGIEIRRDA